LGRGRERKFRILYMCLHIILILDNTESDNLHVSGKGECKPTNCISEMFLKLNQGRGGEKKGEKRTN
jgi:hypothetical protein